MKRLISGIVAGSALLAGCSTTSAEKAPTSSAKPAAVYACDKRLDVNFLPGYEPAAVKAETKLPYRVVASKIGNLTIYYDRDCGSEVRGPVSKAFPNGPLLTSSFCSVKESDKEVGIMDEPLRALNAVSPHDEQISNELINETTHVESLLRLSRVCADQIIEPLGKVIATY